MGRNKASRSRKREEKSKVKLKGHKTKFLPKGQNLTDTRFRVKKIIVPDQLKVHSADQPLTKKKLNVQDVLVRLKHHNTSHRREGLQGLRELVNDADVSFFPIHLGDITTALAKLVLDPEKEVRHDVCKTLRVVLLQVSEKIEPFFETLSSYLGCAMTHIQIGIQEDSLLFLDVLLELNPLLVAKSAQHILPCFLDMISRLRSEQKPDRLLSVNLGGKLSAVEWRTRVLQRLQFLLCAMMDNCKTTMAFDDNVSDATGNKKRNVPDVCMENRHYFPVRSDRLTEECELQVFAQTGASQAARLLLKNADDFMTYIDTLTNLLVECWLEVRPDKKTEDKALSAEASVLLNCTLEIMQLLWEYLKLWEADNSSHNMVSWFRNKYLTTVTRHFLPDFPYNSQGNDQDKSDGSGAKRRKKGGGAEATSIAARPHCVSQNLALCHIFMEMSTTFKGPTGRQIMAYISECVSKKNIGNAESKQLVLAVQCVFRKYNLWVQSKVDLEPLLKAMVERCFAQNHRVEQQLSAVMLEVIQVDYDKRLQSVAAIKTWLRTLPRALCRNNVSIGTLKLFSKLASQKNVPFLGALRQELPSILANMESLTNCGPDGHRCLASILYHVNEWNAEAKTEWKNQHENGHIPSIINEVVSLKCC